MTNKCYVVRVYIDAPDKETASMKVAIAMTGSGESWQVLQSETVLAQGGLSPQSKALQNGARIFRDLTDKIIGGGNE